MSSLTVVRTSAVRVEEAMSLAVREVNPFTKTVASGGEIPAISQRANHLGQGQHFLQGVLNKEIGRSLYSKIGRLTFQHFHLVGREHTA